MQALKRGAFDFITKPWNNARLVAIVQAAAAQPARRAAPASPRASALLGDSAPMRELRR